MDNSSSLAYGKNDNVCIIIDKFIHEAKSHGSSFI